MLAAVEPRGVSLKPDLRRKLEMLSPEQMAVYVRLHSAIGSVNSPDG
jgi:hypothetical protein